MKSKIGLISFFAGISLTVALMVATAYLLIISGAIDPGADQSIPGVERWAAKASIRAYLKSHTPHVQNPLVPNDANLVAGCKLYVNDCAVCHGLADGKKTKIAQGFYKNAPLFASEDWSDETDGLVFWFIEHGVRLTAMPAYNKSLNEKEKWQIVMFVKTMQKLPPSVKSTWQSVKTVEIMQ